MSERLKEVRKMMDANVGEGEERVLDWRFEYEDVENASEEDVEDDGKKRKRETKRKKKKKKRTSYFRYSRKTEEDNHR